MTTFTWLTDVAASTDLAVSGLTLVDLVIGLVIVGAFATALGRRRGLLAAVGSSLATALLCWVAATAVVVWAPAPWGDAVSGSALAAHVPLPVSALQQAQQLTEHLTR